MAVDSLCQVHLRSVRRKTSDAAAATLANKPLVGWYFFSPFVNELGVQLEEANQSANNCRTAMNRVGERKVGLIKRLL